MSSFFILVDIYKFMREKYNKNTVQGLHKYGII